MKKSILLDGGHFQRFPKPQKLYVHNLYIPYH